MPRSSARARPAGAGALELAALLRALMDLEAAGVITKSELAHGRSRLLSVSRPSEHS